MGLMRLTPSMSEGLSEHFLSEPCHQEVSEDAKPPRTGPSFLRLNSIACRLEMLLITITLLVVLFYWRLFVVTDLNLLVTVLWVVFPDLGSFMPIGLAVGGATEWLRWGGAPDNFVQSSLRLFSVLA